MTAYDVMARVASKTSYTPRPYRKTAVPSTAERHLMNRLGCGFSAHTWAQMREAGGASAWFEKQLRPAHVRQNALTKSLAGWFPHLADPPATRIANNLSRHYPMYEYARDLGNWTALRRMYSARQVHETMVDFWSNHLHVPLVAGRSFANRWDYDATLRTHALGRFEDLLVACSLHPSMLLYLDNALSTRGAPNENQGRELLELHTLGRTSGYTEQMVHDSAVILSGWTVDQTTWRAVYDPARHTTGAVRVLDFSDPNDAPDGADLTVRYLRYLANHPATARMVAQRLAVRFVSDTPSPGLVDHLAEVFTTSGTDISATLRALVATREFARSVGGKVRTPFDDLVATVRVLGVTASEPTGERSFANALSYLPQSMLLYQWPRPDGAPETDPEWASVSRMLSSYRMHWVLAGGYYPTKRVSYRSPSSWLPERSLRLDAYVDHVSRLLLARPSTSTDLKAVCQATGHTPGETINAKHPLAGWKFVRLAVALLDSPDHMSR